MAGIGAGDPADYYDDYYDDYHRERAALAQACDEAQQLAQERDEARADLRDLSEAVKAAWHQCNSAGLKREQYAALHRAFEVAVARHAG